MSKDLSQSPSTDIVKATPYDGVPARFRQAVDIALKSPVTVHMWKAITDLNVRKLPVSELALADYLQVTIRPYPRTDDRFPRALPPAIFSEEDRTIYVDPRGPYTRQRFSVFHECAHQLIPWHRTMSVEYLQALAGTPLYRQLEDEADWGACELAMPAPWFVCHMEHYKQVTWQSVSTIADDYVMSLESVTNRYVSFHPDPCAFIVCEPLWSTPDPAENVVFTVKYAVASSAFPFYVAKDTIIDDSECILRSVGSTTRVPVHSTQLGVDANEVLHIEAKRVGVPTTRFYVLATM